MARAVWWWREEPVGAASSGETRCEGHGGVARDRAPGPGVRKAFLGAVMELILVHELAETV
eukprot:15436802-Alexandrium_andersonii.AAC.1